MTFYERMVTGRVTGIQLVRCAVAVIVTYKAGLGRTRLTKLASLAIVILKPSIRTQPTFIHLEGEI